MAKLNDIEKITQQVTQDVKTQNIQDGLAEIYQDDQGQLVDVQKLQIKKKKTWWQRSLLLLLYLAMAGLLAGGGYYFYLSSGNSSDLEVSWSGNSAPMNGQEQSYLLTVKNTGKIAIKELDLFATLPETFELGATDPAQVNQQGWHWPQLAPGDSATVIVKGRFFGLAGKSNLFTAEATYKPDNFSATFKKSASLEAVVSQSGLILDIVRPTNVLVGEKQTMTIKYHMADGSNIDNFRLSVEPSQPGNVELIQDGLPLDHAKMIKPWVWQTYQLGTQERELTITFKVLNKSDRLDNFKFRFDYWIPNDPASLTAMYQATTTTSTESRLGSMEPAASSTTSSTLDFKTNQDRYLTIAEENYDINIIKNDLNLLLIENGTDKDQSADFGQTLTFSINYSNKGLQPLENIVISANLEGELIDWKSFSDKYGAKIQGNTVSWTKSELPDLARLDKDAKGTIDFSVKLKELSALKGLSITKPQLKAYANFSTSKIGDIKEIVAQIDTRDQQALAKDTAMALPATDTISSTASSTDNMSNIIITHLNSDLQLDEQLLYYSADNEAIGSGPVPLQAGQTTTLRNFWHLTNTLHNLSSIEISVSLPEYVQVSGAPTASIGNINYDPATHRLVWAISRLDKAAAEQTAQFDIAITPTDSQRNKLLIIFPKTDISANDEESGSQIRKEIKPRTSKFEDDAMIQQTVTNLNGGLVK